MLISLVFIFFIEGLQYINECFLMAAFFVCLTWSSFRLALILVHYLHVLSLVFFTLFRIIMNLMISSQSSILRLLLDFYLIFWFFQLQKNPLVPVSNFLFFYSTYELLFLFCIDYEQSNYTVTSMLISIISNKAIIMWAFVTKFINILYGPLIQVSKNWWKNFN